MTGAKYFSNARKASESAIRVTSVGLGAEKAGNRIGSHAAFGR